MKQEPSRLTLIYFRTPASGMACAHSAANWGSEGPASAPVARRDHGDSWDARRACVGHGARGLANELGLARRSRRVSWSWSGEGRGGVVHSVQHTALPARPCSAKSARACKRAAMHLEGASRLACLACLACLLAAALCVGRAFLARRALLPCCSCACPAPPFPALARSCLPACLLPLAPASCWSVGRRRLLGLACSRSSLSTQTLLPLRQSTSLISPPSSCTHLFMATPHVDALPNLATSLYK